MPLLMHRPMKSINNDDEDEACEIDSDDDSENNDNEESKNESLMQVKVITQHDESMGSSCTANFK